MRAGAILAACCCTAACAARRDTEDDSHRISPLLSGAANVLRVLGGEKKPDPGEAGHPLAAAGGKRCSNASREVCEGARCRWFAGPGGSDCFEQGASQLARAAGHGARTISVKNPEGFKVGDLISIYDEVNRVGAIRGGDLELIEPLGSGRSYAAGDSPAAGSGIVVATANDGVVGYWSNRLGYDVPVLRRGMSGPLHVCCCYGDFKQKGVDLDYFPCEWREGAPAKSGLALFGASTHCGGSGWKSFTKASSRGKVVTIPRGCRDMPRHLRWKLREDLLQNRLWHQGGAPAGAGG